MSTLADRVFAHAKTQGPKCPVPRLMALLADDTERAELAELLADPSVQSTVVSRWALAEHDFRLRADTLRDHRRGDCSCGVLAEKQAGKR